MLAAQERHAAVSRRQHKEMLVDIIQCFHTGDGRQLQVTFGHASHDEDDASDEWQADASLMLEEEDGAESQPSAQTSHDAPSNTQHVMGGSLSRPADGETCHCGSSVPS